VNVNNAGSLSNIDRCLFKTMTDATETNTQRISVKLNDNMAYQYE